MRKPAAISVQIPCLSWKAAWKTVRVDVRVAVKATLAYEQQVGADIAIVLCDDATITPLNATYRAKLKPTNVLSFPAEEEEMLGDVLLSFETIAAEATEQEKDFVHHATHLVVHGVLHLLGYDHEVDAQALEMEQREITILARLGIVNPYEKD